MKIGPPADNCINPELVREIEEALLLKRLKLEAAQSAADKAKNEVVEMVFIFLM